MTGKINTVPIHLQLRELTEHLEQVVNRRIEALHLAKSRLQRELVERKETEEAALRQSESVRPEL